MGFLKEFKAFAMRGNVIDLAIGVVIGAAFGKIVSSLVADIIMPLIGFLTGGVNLLDHKIVLRSATEGIPGVQKAVPALTLNWGNFVQTTVDFLIIALCIFLFIKTMARFYKSLEKLKTADKGPTQEELLTEIRDLLKKS